MKLLVTGGDGFVGGWLIRALLRAGHTVTATGGPEGSRSAVLDHDERRAVEWRPLDLRSTESVSAAVAGRWDAVLHLAAVASGAEARRDPGHAWEVNAAGTARLAEAATQGEPLFLLVSTGEVYGEGQGAPRRESDPVAPCSPYAASKAGAELAAGETARRTGLRLIVARPFPHTGPGQDQRFVVPALASRLQAARAEGATVIRAGNLEPVRDLLDVRDVAAAYLALLEHGAPGIYNVASGEGHRLADLVTRMQERLGTRIAVEVDPALGRRSDILHLVGDPSRLRAATGWTPRIALDQTLRELLDAQTV
jgi:GDP-4-dehydro-6-deoxy-D-mannose reductase